MRCSWRTFLALFMVFPALGTPVLTAQQNVARELVRPSQADPSIREFDEPNLVLTPAGGESLPPLAIFLPGTNGKPTNAGSLLQVIAGQGYRVIGLSYNDSPAAVQICPRDPHPNCYAAFRAMRTFGQGPAPVNNSQAESIESRLVSLLRYLDREHPEQQWSAYVGRDGHPDWSRILVSGLSQGAGMAAYIAKFYPVYRVVLFSSPWDFTGPGRRPAPWIFERSATPPERWWAERHVRENTTALIANAYAALGIPPRHILLFEEGLAETQTAPGENPYHVSTVLNRAYTPQWQILYGSPGSADR